MQQAIKTEARLRLLENIASTNIAISCMQAAGHVDPKEIFQTVWKRVLDGARSQTFPDLDPAMSDLFAAEIEDAATRLGSTIADQIDLLRRHQQ